MKKVLAIIGWSLMMCWISSCSRQTEETFGESSKLQRARQIVRTDNEVPDSEIYKAKALLFEVIAVNPTDLEANRMLAEIYFTQSAKLMESLRDDASLAQLDMVQNRRVIFLQKALYHLDKIKDTSPLRKSIEKELYMDEE